MDREQLAAALRRVLPADRIVTAPAELANYAYDASFFAQRHPRPPDVAVLPASAEEVARVMAFAWKHRIPVTPRGAATGQAGGAVPIRGGISLALHRLNRVLEIDVDNLQALVEPGVVHARLNAQLARSGLVFPPDPGSSRMCTVGGMASTNAHGMRAVKYGPTSNWVLGLEVVLPDGRVITTGSVGSRARQSSSGLELTRLFVGAEGTLGVITKLRLKLMPIPPARAIVLALFATLEDAGRVVGATFRSGVQPSAIEVLDAAAIQAVNRYRPGIGLPEVEALLLFEVDGNPPGVQHDAERVVAAVSGLATRAEWSTDPARIAALWEARSVVGAAVATLRPGANRAYCGEDIAVPISRVPEALRRVAEIGRKYGVVVATYGHIGSGGLHPGFLIDATSPEEVERVLRVADEVHRLALELQGTTTGEHGVGSVRTPYMELEHGAALAVMRQIKQALDPYGIMNPGKLFPETSAPAAAASLAERAAVGAGSAEGERA